MQLTGFENWDAASEKPLQGDSPITAERLQELRDVLARDYACHKAYGKGILESGVAKSLSDYYFSASAACLSVHHKVVEMGEAKTENPDAKPHICYACHFQDMIAGIKDAESEERAKARAEEHAQRDYEAKIAERMGR